jgi:NNP family nitrate/nitrite transporter-like MFS transporter
LGRFFPPIVLGVVKQMTGSYTIGFVILALVALAALLLDMVVFLRSASSVVVEAPLPVNA